MKSKIHENLGLTLNTLSKTTIFLGIMLLSFCLTAQSTLSERDQKFLQEAMEGSMLEVKLGELAQRNASSQQVKDLGQTMIKDHSKAITELKKLASEKNLVLPESLGEKSQKHYDMLAKKTGKDFDKAYSKCMVMDHKKDICKFRKEAKKGYDA